jgi:hypothetical protein
LGRAGSAGSLLAHRAVTPLPSCES